MDFHQSLKRNSQRYKNIDRAMYRKRNSNLSAPTLNRVDSDYGYPSSSFRYTQPQYRNLNTLKPPLTPIKKPNFIEDLKRELLSSLSQKKNSPIQDTSSYTQNREMPRISLREYMQQQDRRENVGLQEQIHADILTNHSASFNETLEQYNHRACRQCSLQNQRYQAHQSNGFVINTQSAFPTLFHRTLSNHKSLEPNNSHRDNECEPTFVDCQTGCCSRKNHCPRSLGVSKKRNSYEQNKDWPFNSSNFATPCSSTESIKDEFQNKPTDQNSLIIKKRISLNAEDPNALIIKKRTSLNAEDYSHQILPLEDSFKPYPQNQKESHKNYIPSANCNCCSCSYSKEPTALNDYSKEKTKSDFANTDSSINFIIEEVNTNLIYSERESSSAQTTKEMKSNPIKKSEQLMLTKQHSTCELATNDVMNDYTGNMEIMEFGENPKALIKFNSKQA